MKTLLKVLLLVFIALAATGITLSAANNEIMLKIIVNSTSGAASQISSDDITRIFLMRRTSLSDGTHVEPVLQREGAVYHAFLKKYIGKTDSALTIYYRTLVFTGKAPMPKSLNSDAEVVTYVTRNKGVIGFVSVDTNTSGVKTLRVK